MILFDHGTKFPIFKNFLNYIRADYFLCNMDSSTAEEYGIWFESKLLPFGAIINEDDHLIYFENEEDMVAFVLRFS